MNPKQVQAGDTIQAIRINNDEFTKYHRWRMLISDSHKANFVTGTFADIEYKYFEGYNIPYKINWLGITEPFESAYDRMKRYYKLTYDERKSLRSKMRPESGKEGKRHGK
jgi:hypothetical protein